MGNSNKTNKNQNSKKENIENEEKSKIQREKSNYIDDQNLENEKFEENPQILYQAQNLEIKNNKFMNFHPNIEDNNDNINLLYNTVNIKNLAISSLHEISPNYTNYKSNPSKSISLSNENKNNDPQKDLLIINNFLKKCNEFIIQANSKIKENKISSAYELLNKAESGLINLKEILNKKTEINSNELSKINLKIEETMAFIYRRYEFCGKITNNVIKDNINSNISKSYNAYNTNNRIEPNYGSNKIVENNTSTNPNTNTYTNNSNSKDKIIKDDIKSKIFSEIMETTNSVKFDDILGMENVKQILREIIILPQIRPDIFTGLRTPPKGLLLFGPPGTGKTFIAKAVASECKCTFFNISASSLTSKWLGESEKLVRALFEIAKINQPSIIFFDEIESILSKRSDDDNESSKRIKTEFFIQFDGMHTSSSDRILLIAATNRPQDLDSAILRRLPKRVYVGPLDLEGRKNFLHKTMLNVDNNLSSFDHEKIANFTQNYSNSDLKELCREAAFEPFRELNENQIKKIKKLRPINLKDFGKALKVVRGSLNNIMLKELEEWNTQYGQIY